MNISRLCIPGICLATLILASTGLAATIVWDGTTDNNWTNGPQDNSGGGFPANGATGSNWTVDGGGAGQLAVPDANTPGSNLIDYLYTGHDWTINSATINEDVQIKLSGGSLMMADSTVSLLPTSATTTGNLSGLNLGQNASTTAVFTNSTVNVGRSNSAGRAMALINGSSLSLVGSDVNLSAEVGTGKIDLNNASSLSIDATSSLSATGQLDLFGPANILTMGGGTLEVDHIRANSGDEGTQDLMIDFLGGTVTLNGSNPLRDNSSFEGQFNWTGGPGSGSVIHTDLSGTTLAFKVSQGFFSINGTRIDPADTSNVAVLNAELATLKVDGTFFQLNEGAETQTLVLIPEPASAGLTVLLGFYGLMVRRQPRPIHFDDTRANRTSRSG